MHEERKKELHSSIRRLTKKIGLAKKANDFNEIDNLRMQRSKFVKQLADEFHEGYIIEAGKTIFKPIEEVVEHFENPEMKKKVFLADAVTKVCQQRKQMSIRKAKLTSMTPEAVKVQMLKELDAYLGNLESVANSVRKELGETPIDWAEVDKKQAADDDFLSGIDTS